MQVPFFEWSKLYLEDRENYLDLIDRTLSKGGFILQQDVADFEAKIRAHLDIEHSIGVSDGTNAILLGLRADRATRFFSRAMLSLRQRNPSISRVPSR